MRYEDAIGPIDPGCVFTTPDLQKIDREMHTQMARDTVWLTLSVCHPSMDPDEISDALNLDPDDVKLKDDVIFKNEKYYWAQERTFLDREASEAMVATINGLIYKISL